MWSSMRMALAGQLAGDPLAEGLLVGAPGHGRPAGLDRLHGDAAGDRAYEHAEIAAHALLVDDLGHLGGGAVRLHQADRLVGAVPAGQVAIPPMPEMGMPIFGCLATAETMLRAMGLTAGPQ